MQKTSRTDTLLRRISHFSQFGLFALTLGTLYFTVLPIYQKAVLEEAVAKKEIELKTLEKKVVEHYRQIREYAVDQYVFSVGAECSGLLIRPRPFLEFGKPIPNPLSEENEILKIEVTKCMVSRLESASGIKELRKPDFDFFTENVKRVASLLETERRVAIEQYRDLPSKATTNPSILKPLDGYTASLLLLYAKQKLVSEERIAVLRREAEISRSLSHIASAYSEKVRKEITGLRTIKWPVEK